VVSTAVVAILVAMVGLGAVTAAQTQARSDLTLKNGELTRSNLRLERERRGAENREQQENASALAALSRNRDDPDHDDATRARNCTQALNWLKGELDTWRALGDDPKSRAEAVRNLKSWQEDPDLKGVREAEALRLLPETERAAWRTLWENGAQLRSRLESETVDSKPKRPPQTGSEKNPPIPPPS
jgi:hypothetical protein